MASYGYLEVRNWGKWQSYRSDRGAPPWIKVHRRLLSDPDFTSLTDAQKGQLISIWIVAAARNGRVPDDLAVLKKVCALDEEPDIELFLSLQFLEKTGKRRRHRDAKNASTWQPNDAPEEQKNRGSDKEPLPVRFPHDSPVPPAPPPPTASGVPPAAATGANPGGDPSRRPKRAPSATRGTRLPPDWSLYPTLLAWTEEYRANHAEDYCGINLENQVERFRDHWLAQPGSKGVKLSWGATWRNWWRRAPEMRGGNGNGRGKYETPHDRIARLNPAGRESGREDLRDARGEAGGDLGTTLDADELDLRR